MVKLQAINTFQFDRRTVEIIDESEYELQILDIPIAESIVVFDRVTCVARNLDLIIDTDSESKTFYGQFTLQFSPFAPNTRCEEFQSDFLSQLNELQTSGVLGSILEIAEPVEFTEDDCQGDEQVQIIFKLRDDNNITSLVNWVKRIKDEPVKTKLLMHLVPWDEGSSFVLDHQGSIDVIFDYFRVGDVLVQDGYTYELSGMQTNRDHMSGRHFALTPTFGEKKAFNIFEDPTKNSASKEFKENGLFYVDSATEGCEATYERLRHVAVKES